MTKVVAEQEWLSEVTSPSGLEIRYGVKPKRVYQIRKGPKGRWKTVPSVTTVLDVLDKPALPWWGMRVGIQGVLTLVETGLLKPATTFQGAPTLGYTALISQQGPLVTEVDELGNETKYHAYAAPLEQFAVAGQPEIEQLLKQQKLTTNHVRDKAGSRGQNVHDAFEAWAKEGLMPNPSLFPASEAGYVEGLRRFITESGAKPVAAEVMVGSAKHGYAGRFDVRIEYPEDVEIVVHHTPVKGDQRALLAAGLYTDDVKTSKDVFASHAKQLEAYEEAARECGYEPAKGCGVIHVDANGNYKRVPSWATFADFKSTLNEWKSQQAMEKRRKESK